ncbi:MAG TPA: hypothetical protein VGM03_03590 [Phycisphaerae bacterium]|jgi:hypothetical protein
MWSRIRRKSFFALCLLTNGLVFQLTCPVSQAYTQRGLTTILLSNLAGVLNDSFFFTLDSTFVNIS